MAKRYWGQAGALFAVGLVLVLVGIAVETWLVTFNEWLRLGVGALAAVFWSLSIFRASLAWDEGRAERQAKRAVEQWVAKLGHVIWMAGSTFGVVGLIAVTVSKQSTVSIPLGVIGAIWLTISGVMGGMPSMEKGLEPLLLNKRIMNWQLALSVAVAVPLLGKSVGTDKDVFDAVGTNWGYPAIIAVFWILSAGVGTLLYEPLKYRLEASATAKASAERDSRWRDARRRVTAQHVTRRR